MSKVLENKTLSVCTGIFLALTICGDSLAGSPPPAGNPLLSVSGLSPEPLGTTIHQFNLTGTALVADKALKVDTFTFSCPGSVTCYVDINAFGEASETATTPGQVWAFEVYCSSNGGTTYLINPQAPQLLLDSTGHYVSGSYDGAFKASATGTTKCTVEQISSTAGFAGQFQIKYSIYE